MWMPDGAALRARRLALHLTRDEAARKAGVAERTLRRAEAGLAVREPLLASIAEALGVPVEGVATSTRRAPERTADRLARIADEEPLADESVLGAALLRSLYATPLPYDGDSIALQDARVVATEAGSDAEAEALGVPRGLVGRFSVHVLTGRKQLHVTVHTADAASARALHRRVGADASTLHVRVRALAEGAPFAFVGSPRLHAWTLVAQASAHAPHARTSPEPATPAPAATASAAPGPAKPTSRAKSRSRATPNAAEAPRRAKPRLR